MAKNKGTVVQVMGPVLDIRFEEDQLPSLLNAIEVPNGDKTIIAEVAQHIGDNVVRCIAMSSTDGLQRGTEVTDTGAPISVPVGEEICRQSTSDTKRPKTLSKAAKAACGSLPNMSTAASNLPPTATL